MRVVIHGRATSSNVQAVMWGAAEIGLAVERRDLGGRFGGNDTPDYRALHPFGLIPAMEHGDVTLFESAVILRYLVDTFGSGPFDMQPRAASWAEWAKYGLGQAFTVPVFWAYYRTPEAERDMDAVMRGLRGFEERAAMAMAQREKGPWIMGAQISLADVWAGHVLYRYFTLDLPRRVPDGLEAYYAQLCARPAYRSVVMVDYSELKGRKRT